MKKYFIFCILSLQIGLLQAQTNWKYSDHFSAPCMGNVLKSSNVLISIQNDSIIISDSFVHQCCPKFAMRISDIHNDSIYVTFHDTSQIQCDCICRFQPRLNIGKYTYDRLKINYNGIWYSLDGLDFAPIGTEWYYTERTAFDPFISYLKISSVGDTILSGKHCRIIQKEKSPGCNGRPDTEYLYEENSILYFWEEAFNRFQVLYDFNKKVNEFWTIEVNNNRPDKRLDTTKVVVDSISSITINNKSFRVMYVTYKMLSEEHPFSYTSKIIENIGDTQYLFNFFPEFAITVCDGNYAAGLRCYNDPILGNYSTGIAESCTYSGVDGLNELTSANFSIFPNPTDGPFEVYSSTGETLTAELNDIRGRLVLSTEFCTHTRFDLTGYKAGWYILTIKLQNKMIGRMKLVKK